MQDVISKPIFLGAKRVHHSYPRWNIPSMLISNKNVMYAKKLCLADDERCYISNSDFLT